MGQMMICQLCHKAIFECGCKTPQWVFAETVPLDGMTLRQFVAIHITLPLDDDCMSLGSDVATLGEVVGLPCPPVLQMGKMADRLRWRIQAEARLRVMLADALIAELARPRE